MLKQYFEALWRESKSSAKRLYLDTGKIDENIFNSLLKFDPTATSKYIEWMCRTFVKSKYDESDVEKYNIIIDFDKLCNKGLIENKDINSYRNIEQVYDVVKEYENVKTKGEIEKDIKVSGADKVFENDKALVLFIKDENASICYGKGTKWCISAKDNNYFKDYWARGLIDFYFIIRNDIDISNRFYKIAAAVSQTNKLEVYDAEDKKINLNIFKNILKEIGVPVEIFKHKGVSIERVFSEYEIDENGDYTFFGDVKISGLGIKNIKTYLARKYGIKGAIKEVRGDFYLDNNQLKTLEGAPQKVGRDFDCSSNQLTSLEGAPEKVGKSFWCDSNKLITLEGAPRVVGKNFSCGYNSQLTSLKGAPQIVGGDFDCRSNQLTTLEGAPQEVGGDFDCRYNELTTLEGAPQKVDGDFDCDGNQLTTLEGAPQKVDGNFGCDGNQLTTLEGAPQKVDGNFDCDGNQLTTLKGAPQEVGGDFSCCNNQLTTLKGAPQKVGRNFDCNSNQLTNLKGAPQEVDGDFDCSYNQLTSLKGAPQKVGRDFDCDYNKKKFSIEDVKKVSNVKGDILV